MTIEVTTETSPYTDNQKARVQALRDARDLLNTTTTAGVLQQRREPVALGNMVDLAGFILTGVVDPGVWLPPIPGYARASDGLTAILDAVQETRPLPDLDAHDDEDTSHD